jgi:hypothetical protein
MVEREMHLPFTAFGSLEANLNLEALSVKYASPELYRGSSAPLGRSGSGAAQGPALDSAARGGGDDGGGIGANGGGGGGGGGADEARDAFDLDGLVGSFSDRGQPLRQSQRMVRAKLGDRASGARPVSDSKVKWDMLRSRVAHAGAAGQPPT